MGVRLDARAKNPSRDERARLEVEQAEQMFADLCDEQPPGPLPAPVEEVAFLIEELRLSLLAQGVRTAVPISLKRLRQAVAAARTSVG